MNTCPVCGGIINPKPPAPKSISFRDNNNIVVTANAIPLNDAFMEIVSGKYRGNLVHIWNLIK